MMSHLREVGMLKCRFKRLEISHISRGNNCHADSLATLTSSVEYPFPRMVTVELLPFSNLTTFDNNLVLSIHSSVSWMDPIIAYLQNGILPEDKKKSEQIRCRSPQYWVFKEEKLYKRSYSGHYPLCVHLEAIEMLLEELYEGICGSHTRGRLLAH